jgi:uncharacterized membrane protein YkoI
MSKTLWLGATVFAAVMLAETKVKMEDLPPAVQKAVKEQTKDAALIGLSKEKEKGKTMYEVETKVNGKSRDLLLDSAGAVVSVEDEVDLSSIPDAARTAIQKNAAGGTVQKVEKVTQGSTVSYEGSIKTKSGKTIEVAVNADGTPHKE